MDVPAPCPHCHAELTWDLDLQIDRELAWASPNGPVFRFVCPVCGHPVGIRLDWSLRRGHDPRSLRMVSDGRSPAERPCILLVERCPHGCGTKLGLQLLPDDPWAKSTTPAGVDQVLGGYRCPTCDGEGRLHVRLDLK